MSPSRCFLLEDLFLFRVKETSYLKYQLLLLRHVNVRSNCVRHAYCSPSIMASIIAHTDLFIYKESLLFIHPRISRFLEIVNVVNLLWLAAIIGRLPGLMVKPNTYLNSAKTKHSRHTNFFYKKRVFQSPSNFRRSFFIPNFTGILTKSGWKLSTWP